MTDAESKPAEGRVEVTVSQEAPDWGDFLRRRDDARLAHDPGWGRVMCEAYGNRPYYLTATRGGAVVGILQLVHQKSLLFGSHLSSLPYLDASGVLADDAAASEALLAAARRLLGEAGAEWIELRGAGPIDEALPERTDKLTLHLELPADADALWQGFKPKVRNQVRKAEKADLAAEAGGAELLEEFFGVYTRNMRDLGSPPHSRRFFRLVAEAFGERLRLFVVRLADEPIAAGLTLTDARARLVPWAASDWRFRRLNANMLLYWQMLKDACEGDVPVFDFGRSTRDSGTHRFKRQWGAEEVPLCWQYLLAAGAEMPDLRPDSRKYRLAVAVWRKMPVWLVRLAGPRIVSKLS
jgi:FemAB-related protein (PEP-CTERM system-associated)